jgi:hypothetical protein
MAKLNQIVAIEKGIKAKTYGELTQAHHALQKEDLLKGLTRTYRPIDEEGEKFPAESKKVQIKADDIIKDTAEILTKLFDVTATKDYSNCTAAADVVVNGKVLVKKAPVPFLLFLEKQLVDIMTFVKKLPVLDPTMDWRWDDTRGCFCTEPVDTTKTKKVPKNHVKAAATDKHPAQVDVFTEDVVVGYWTKTEFSGALPQMRVNELVQRVSDLQAAVKFAREEANSHEAQTVSVGKEIFGYLFTYLFK